MRATFGRWSVARLRVCAGTHGNTCTAHFVWRGNNDRSDDVSRRVIMVILDVNSYGKIANIFEVYSSILSADTKVVQFPSSNEEK